METLTIIGIIIVWLGLGVLAAYIDAKKISTLPYTFKKVILTSLLGGLSLLILIFAMLMYLILEVSLWKGWDKIIFKPW